ncbi:MAG TPA: hypothetical protein VNL16_09975 [Chloroflexota bacterium]|nr:hypothetical protein [Chloroflexota bacterium]
MSSAEPSKRPVGTNEGLCYGMDVDGTITRAPRHFKRLVDALLDHGDEVYIVTGRWERIRGETGALLASLEIRYTALLMRPDTWPGTVAEFKVRGVQEARLHITIDDDQRDCWAINEQTEALRGAHVAIPGNARGVREQRPLLPLAEGLAHDLGIRGLVGLLLLAALAMVTSGISSSALILVTSN